MRELVIYLEIKGLGVDDEGNPVPAGVRISAGKVAKEVDYSEIAAILDLSNVADFFHVQREDIAVLTPEKYKEVYGEA